MNEMDYSREFNYKIINDPLYGCIGLSKTEVELIDTRAMQRLRHIKQMGFASYVYPSGEHSRFVHSLGVLCIMGKMCEHLFRKYGKSTSPELKFTIEDAKLLRAAALLHDVGHFPFSHLSECVFSYIDSRSSDYEMIENYKTIEESAASICLISNFKKRKEKDHEHMGKIVIERDTEIRNILVASGLEPGIIGDIVIGDSSAKPIYAQLLHSSIDADRLDYLLRDSNQAGVTFGSVELDYIIRQLRIEMCTIKEIDGTELLMPLIVFDGRAKHALEHFLMGRYFHYRQVVFHKTSIAFESIAKTLLYCVISRSEEHFPYKNFDSIAHTIGTDEFYSFTDDLLWQYTEGFAKRTDDEFVKLLWKSLSQRKKPISVLSYSDIIPKFPQNPKSKPINDSTYYTARWLAENSLSKMAEVSSISPNNVWYVETKVFLESIPSYLRSDEVTMQGFDDATRGAIRIIDKEGTISFLASDNKSLINKMVDFTANNLEIFIIGDVEPDMLDTFRTEITKGARS